MYTSNTVAGDPFILDTPEIARARALPWRDWAKDPNLPELKLLLNAWLQHTPQKCTPRCTCCKKVDGLNDPQAAFLGELYHLGRAANPFRTGAGKTLASLLAITVLERRNGPQRALLITPASGRAKTMGEARDYAKHWRCGAFQHVTYEFLANPKNKNWLIEYTPTLVIADEAHKLTPGSKAATRLAACAKVMLTQGRQFRFIPFTASMSSRRITECWHYLRLAMGDACPLPATRVEAEIWGKATDEKVPVDAQIHPGALLSLAPEQTGDGPRHRAQLALGARLAATPGYVSTLEDIPPITLKLHATRIRMPPDVEEMLRVLRDKFTLPSGETFTLAWDVWKHSRSIGCGLYYRWDPPAPRAWLEARKAYHAFVREYLSTHHKIDSPVHVANGIDSGEIHDGGLLQAWRYIEPYFTPHSVAEWVHTETLEYAKRWLGEHERGICWVEQRPFGERLAAETGLPYFAAGAKDARSGRSLFGMEGSPIIVSSKHSEQFNLQYYCDNLITSAAPMGKTENQRLGRTLREGQDSNEVSAEYLLTTLESETSLQACFRDAKREQAVSGGQPQKLCYGELMDAEIAAFRD